MRIHRDGRVDDGAAVIVDEVMREVGAAAGETDANRRAGAGEYFALLAEIEQVPAEYVHQPAFGIEDRDDMDPLVEQLEDLFAGCAGARPHEVAVDAGRYLLGMDIPSSNFLRMSPSVTAPTTRPPASCANKMPSMLALRRRNASSIVSVSVMVRWLLSGNVRIQRRQSGPVGGERKSPGNASILGFKVPR